MSRILVANVGRELGVLFSYTVGRRMAGDPSMEGGKGSVIKLLAVLSRLWKFTFTKPACRERLLDHHPRTHPPNLV